LLRDISSERIPPFRVKSIQITVVAIFFVPFVVLAFRCLNKDHIVIGANIIVQKDKIPVFTLVGIQKVKKVSSIHINPFDILTVAGSVFPY
jgi:hypothetical protein